MSKRPLVGLNLAKEQFDEGRFSGAVAAHDAHFLETGKVVIKVLEDDG